MGDWSGEVSDNSCDTTPTSRRTHTNGGANGEGETSERSSRRASKQANRAEDREVSPFGLLLCLDVAALTARPPRAVVGRGQPSAERGSGR